MGVESPYWLFGWLDAHRIKRTEDLRILLGNENVLRELRDVADEWADSDPWVPDSGFNLVAGTGLRLDDLMTCPSFACRRQQVDILFRHAWHYFDRILLPDGVGEHLRYGNRNDLPVFLETLESWIGLAMYIRDLEATDLVCFYRKHGLPPRNFLEDSLGANYTSFLGGVDELKQQIIQEGQFNFVKEDHATVHVSFFDRILGVETEMDLDIPEGQVANESYLRNETAREILVEHIGHLSEDLHAKKHLTGTLGSIVWTHELLLSRIAQPIARDIVLKLSLPSIDRVPVKELIAIRNAEGDSFASFRAALTSAVQNLISSAPNSNSADLSRLVVEEFIQPELTKIDRRLRSAKSTLARKTAVSLAVGALATKCGLLLGLGPAAGTIGLGAIVAASVAAGAKYIEEKQSIELSDMYFLWNALGHAQERRGISESF